MLYSDVLPGTSVMLGSIEAYVYEVTFRRGSEKPYFMLRWWVEGNPVFGEFVRDEFDVR